MRTEKVLEDAEIEEIREIARRRKRLRAVQAAAGQAFPTGDIDQMLSEIEQGYRVTAGM
jgi:hypothetical protein